MNTKEAIYSRRAVRQYTGQAVDDVTIHELLEAATQAPSGINQQPWVFVIVQDTGILRKISDRAQELLREGPEFVHLPPELRAPIEAGEFDIFYNAGTLIVICERSQFPHGDWDCCFAAQNLMLAARARGLGTCPIGFAWGALEDPDIRSEIGIPTDCRPILPIILGHVQTFPPSPGRKPPEIASWLRDQTPAAT